MLPFIFMHMNQLPKFVATFFGLGFIPVAPGTFGALGGFIVSYLLLVLGFDFGIWFNPPSTLMVLNEQERVGRRSRPKGFYQDGKNQMADDCLN